MSSDQARKYHSVTFGDKNTWDDWGLIPTVRPSVAPPELIETDAGADSSDGDIDTTDVLGQTYFGLSKGSLNFLVYNKATVTHAYHGWAAVQSKVMNHLHNRRCRMILDDDPDYYYEGRFQVSFSTGKNFSSVTISYALDVYKQSLV